VEWTRGTVCVLGKPREGKALLWDSRHWRADVQAFVAARIHAKVGAHSRTHGGGVNLRKKLEKLESREKQLNSLGPARSRTSRVLAFDRGRHAELNRLSLYFLLQDPVAITNIRQ
jgi:hypothetical protein